MRRGRSRPPADASAARRLRRRPGIVERALPYTMTGAARLQALVDAVRYCVARDLPGAFAECGVWRGGSVLAMVLDAPGARRRRPRPLPLRHLRGHDRAHRGRRLRARPAGAGDLARRRSATGGRPWAELLRPRRSTRTRCASCSWPPATRPSASTSCAGRSRRRCPPRRRSDLALLRLDTDWYESTRHELDHLYPRLVRRRRADRRRLRPLAGRARGGRRVLRRATARPPLLQPRSTTPARIAVKP